MDCRTLEMDLIPAKDILEFKAWRQYYCSLPYREGDKSRIQLFKGDVLSAQRHWSYTDLHCRKISNGVLGERIFPLFSPNIERSR